MSKITGISHSSRARDQLYTSLTVRFAFQILNAKYQPYQAERSLQSPKIWLPKPGTHHSCGACLQQIPLSSLLTVFWLISERDLGSPWLAEVNAKSLIRQNPSKDDVSQAVSSACQQQCCTPDAQARLHSPFQPCQEPGEQHRSISAGCPCKGNFNWLGHAARASFPAKLFLCHSSAGGVCCTFLHLYKQTAQCWWLGLLEVGSVGMGMLTFW